MPMPEPKAITAQDHPSCIRVMSGIDLLDAFDLAAAVLAPDNLTTRGILWLPPAAPDLDAEIAARANQNDFNYFQDHAHFRRREIFNHLGRPEYVFHLSPPAPRVSDFASRYSSNKNDYSGEIAGQPHIDGPPSGSTPSPHVIRALIYNFAESPQSTGSLFYTAIIHEHDIDDAGIILDPDPVLGRQGTDKLGQPFRITHRRAAFFLNVGGPVECQLAHEASRTPTYPAETLPRITRALDRYDFSTR